MGIDNALEELARHSSTPEEALKLIEALEGKRKIDKFICYWNATPSQKKDVFPKFTSDIKIFGVLGGNRSGKTETGAFIATAWALGKEYFRGEPAWELVKDLPIPEPPNNIWVVGLDFSTLKDVIWHEKLRYGRNHAGLVPKDALVKPPNDSDFKIFFKNGSVITGKSADSGREKFQSASVDLVWIDEEPEADVFDECYQRTSDCAGKILITLTPLVDINSGVKKPWVFDLYTDERNGATDIRFTKLSVLDNPFVPEVEKEKLKIKWAGHPEERARLYGDFVQRAGLVYKTWRRTAHLTPRQKISRDSYKIACIDPAPTGPTACTWASIEPNGDMIVYDTYKQANLTATDHAKNILAQNGGEIVDLWLIDPKGGGQRNAETHRTIADLYRAAGIPVRFPHMTPDYGVAASMEYINATLDPTSRHPKVRVFADLPDFVEEIERYVWDFYSKGEQTGLSKDKPKKGFDDIMNAWQYICSHMRGKRPPRVAQGTSKLSGFSKELSAKLNSYT
jgi:phage terminase large subunit-like protein